MSEQALEVGDLLLVQRGQEQYNMDAADKSNLLDTDQMLVQRDGINYRVDASAVKGSGITAPFIEGVTLTNADLVTTRFTDESFPIEIICDDTIPASTLALTAKCEGALFDSAVISPPIVSQSPDYTQITFGGTGDLAKFPQGTPVKMVTQVGEDAVITSVTDEIETVGLDLANISTAFIKQEGVDLSIDLSTYDSDVPVYILTILSGSKGSTGSSQTPGQTYPSPGGAGGAAGNLFIRSTTVGDLGANQIVLDGINTYGGTQVGTGGGGDTNATITGDVSFPGLTITAGVKGSTGYLSNSNPGNPTDSPGEGGKGGGGGFKLAFDSATDITAGNFEVLIDTEAKGEKGQIGQVYNSGGGGGEGGEGYGGGGGGGGGGKDQPAPGGVGGEGNPGLHLVLIPEIATTLKFPTNNQLRNFNPGDEVQLSTEGGPAVKVLVSNTFDNVMSVTGGSWTGTDGSFQSQEGYDNETNVSCTKQGFGTLDFVVNNVANILDSNGQWLPDYIMAPVDPVIVDVSRVYLKIAGDSDNPTVIGMDSAKQPPFKLTTKTPVLKFPSLFASGNTPDEDLKFPANLSITVTQENSIGSYEKNSEPVYPVNPVVEGGSSQIKEVDNNNLIFLDSTNFELLVGKSLTMINLDGTIAKDTFSSSNVTSASIFTSPDYSLTRSGWCNSPTGMSFTETKGDFDNSTETNQSWNSNGGWNSSPNAGSWGVNYAFNSYEGGGIGTESSTVKVKFTATYGQPREGKYQFNDEGWIYVWNQNDQNIGGNAGFGPREVEYTGKVTSFKLDFQQGGGTGGGIGGGVYYFMVDGELLVGVENYTDIGLTDGTNLGRFVIGANVSQASGAKGVVRNIDTANNTVRIDNEEGAPAFVLNEPLICELTGTGVANSVDEETNIIQIGNSNGQWVAGYCAGSIDTKLFTNNPGDVERFNELSAAMDNYESAVQVRKEQRRAVIAGLSTKEQSLFYEEKSN